MGVILIVYLVGVAINLLLTIYEESSFLLPIWKAVFKYPRDKETWIAVLDKVLFIGGSFLAYFVFGVIYYISMWKK